MDADVVPLIEMGIPHPHSFFSLDIPLPGWSGRSKVTEFGALAVPTL